MTNAFARTTRRTTLSHLRHVAPVFPDRAGRSVAEVYAQVEADFGLLAPPIALHAAAPDVLAASWAMLRETLLVPGLAGRAAKEEVAVAVSAANSCPYCVDIHAATIAGLGGRHLPDSPRGLWATGAGPAPFPEAHAGELIGVAVTFHYLNRMVNVFLADSPLPAMPAALSGVARRGAGWVLGRLAGREVAPGLSARLLEPAPLPADVAWAREPQHVADAFAGATAVIDAAGRRAVPRSVRALVRSSLADGAGAPTAGSPGSGAAGLGGWLDAMVADLPAAERAGGRFALLIASASYRVGDEVVDDFRAQGGDERTLIEFSAWVSLTAARRAGEVLHGSIAAG